MLLPRTVEFVEGTKLTPTSAMGRTTDVTAAAMLFAGCGSVSRPKTAPVLVIRPAEFGWVRIEIAALAPTPMDPRLAIMTPPLVVQEPWDGTAEIRLRLEGSTFVKPTPLAEPGPALVMVKL